MDGLDLCWRKNTTLNGLIKEIRNDGLTAFNPLKFAVHHLDVEFFLSAFLGNTRAHVACADDRYTLNGLHDVSEFNAVHKNPSS